MKITWLGSASIAIESDGRKILFDPFAELIGGSHPESLDLFAEYDVIFITHGHFDHLFFVPEILEMSGATVFCGEKAAETLEKYMEDTDTVCVIQPGIKIPVGPFAVRVYRGKHAEFAPGKGALREYLRPAHILRNIRNLPFIVYAHTHFKESGETLVYGIEAEGKQILLAGSLNFAPEDLETYPDKPDLLILPYQGCLDREARTQEMIERVHPKRILLSHFDDAFPPVSRNVDLRGLGRLMKTEYPQIPVVRPTFGKPVRL